MEIEILGYSFKYVSNICPDKDPKGNILEFFPQNRYVNKKSLSLHKYGAGPFCKFRINKNLSIPAVYIIRAEEDIFYVGECQDLSSRFNAGYGNISPRNCFEGGQRTNCRINNLILLRVENGLKIELWFFQTRNRKQIEAELISRTQPLWNNQLKF